MIKKDTLDFLNDIRSNNNKPWMEKNRERFESAKENFEMLVNDTILNLGRLDEDIALLRVKDCIFRQHRDIRFSKDKRPYKHHMGAYFNRGTKKINTAGYYIHIEPGKSIVAGGLYEPVAEALAKVRQE